jgi:putative salt-induced outer membrane protein YdiY
VSATSRLDATRRSASDRLAVKGLWDYIETDDRVSDRRTFGEGRYDFFFAEKVFAFTSHGFERSLAQELTLRYNGGVGGGYQFFETKPLDIYTDMSLAYVREDYGTDRTVQPSVSQDDEYLAGKGTGKLTWRVNKTVSLIQEVSALTSLQDVSDVNVRADTLLRVSVIEGFGVTLSWIVEYDNTPAAGKERVDMLFNAGLGYSF